MAACSHCSLSLYYPPQVIADAITCSPQRGHGHCRSAPMSMPIFIVSSPVEIASRFPLPPEGAVALPLRCFAAFFHLTYAYAPGFARCLRRCESPAIACTNAYAPGFARCLRRCESPAIACTNLLRRFRIVLSTRKNC